MSHWHTRKCVVFLNSGVLFTEFRQASSAYWHGRCNLEWINCHASLHNHFCHSPLSSINAAVVTAAAKACFPWGWVWMDPEHKDCGVRAHSLGNKCLFWLTDRQSCSASSFLLHNQEFKLLYLVFTNGLPSILSDHPCNCPSPGLLFFHLTTYLLDYIALQRVSFCCTTPWLNHMYTCISVGLYFGGFQNHCRWWLQPWN